MRSNPRESIKYARENGSEVDVAVRKIKSERRRRKEEAGEGEPLPLSPWWLAERTLLRLKILRA